MTYDIHGNFGYTTVGVAPSPAISGTSLTVNDGSVFPTTPFNITIWPTRAIPLLSNAEIATVTNVAANVLTLTRAQEGSNARTIVVGDQVAATITAKLFNDIERSAPLAATQPQAAVDITMIENSTLAVLDYVEVPASQMFEIRATAVLEVAGSGDQPANDVPSFRAYPTVSNGRVEQGCFAAVADYLEVGLGLYMEFDVQSLFEVTAPFDADF